METKEFRTYEMNPPLSSDMKMIFEDYKSAEMFDKVLQEMEVGFIEPVFLDNQRWAQIKEGCKLYPDEFTHGVKLIVPNPRRHDKLKRTQDKTLLNRYSDFLDVWDVTYLGYFTEFGCKGRISRLHYDKAKAGQFERNAWESYLSESEKFRIENNFNWAYLEKFSPGIMRDRLINDCVDMFCS